MTYPYIPALKHGGAQSAISRIVIHATVSPCVRGGARNVAAYFQSAAAGGSAHYIVDPGEIVQCVRDDVVAYHAPPNAGTLGVELCDWQKGEAARWSDEPHTAMLRLAAKLVRQLAAEHDVPLKLLTVADLKAGRRGICSHVAISNAFKQSDHGDPDMAGPFPWTRFMQLITEEEDMLNADDKKWLETALRAAMKDVAYDAVWERDKMPAPDGDPANPTWRPSSVVTDTNKRVRAVLAALAAAPGVDVDEQAIVTGVLTGLDPSAVAAAVASALPADLARQVVDELAARLDRG